MDAVDACAHLVRGRMDWNPGTGTGVADAQALLIRKFGLSVSASLDMFEMTPRMATHFLCLKQTKRVGNHRGFFFETVLRILRSALSVFVVRILMQRFYVFLQNFFSLPSFF